MNASEPTEDGRAGGGRRVVWTVLFCFVVIAAAILLMRSRGSRSARTAGAGQTGISQTSSRPKLLPYSGRDSYQGFEVIPGTYELTWALQDKPDGQNYSYSLDPLSAGVRAKITGRLSSRALYISSWPYATIVDGSKGHFNVAYIFPLTWLGKGRKVNLAKAWRLPLKPHGGSVTGGHLTVTLILGRGSDVISEQGDVSVEVRPSGHGHYQGDFTWSGGWYGMLRTTNGTYKMQAVDSDSNGDYDGTKSDFYLCNSCGTYHETSDDMLQIEGLESCSGTDRSYGEGSCSPRGISLIEGKLYDIRVSATGDGVSVKRYAGPTATVEVQAVDGFGALAGFAVGFQHGHSRWLLFSGVGSRTVKLPPGDYKVSGLVGVPASCIPKDMSDRGYECMDFTMPAIKLAAGQVVRIKLGGPIAFAILPDVSPILVKHGDKKMVTLALRMPDATSCEASINGSGGRPVQVAVRSADGKVVKKLTVGEYYEEGHPLASFDAGALPQGDYTVSAYSDFGIYSPKASATAKIKVTP